MVLYDVYYVKDRDSQKTTWIGKFVEEVKNDRMVLPALKQIREIFQLFSEVCRLSVISSFLLLSGVSRLQFIICHELHLSQIYSTSN